MAEEICTNNVKVKDKNKKINRKTPFEEIEEEENDNEDI